MTTVLGIDTSTADAAVAVARGGKLVAERREGPGGGGGRPRHSAVLLDAIESAVDEAGGWERVELIGVGVGPGSFTGLRIGIATVRGLAQSRGLPVAAVSSLAALARGVGGLDEAAGRPRLAAIDARRGELFAALYDAGGEEQWPPLAAAPEELGKRVAELPESPLAAGDGALRFRDQLEAAGATVPPDNEPVHRIAARHICSMAEAQAPSRPDEIEPMYLREPDAEIWLDRDSR